MPTDPDDETPIPNRDEYIEQRYAAAALCQAAWATHAEAKARVDEMKRMLAEVERDAADAEVEARRADALLLALDPEFSDPRYGSFVGRRSEATGYPDRAAFEAWSEKTGRSKLTPPALKALADDGFKFGKNGVMKNEKTGEVVPGVLKEVSWKKVFQPATADDLAAALAAGVGRDA